MEGDGEGRGGVGELMRWGEARERLWGDKGPTSTATRPWVAVNPVAPSLLFLHISLGSPEDARHGGQHLACRLSPPPSLRFDPQQVDSDGADLILICSKAQSEQTVPPCSSGANKLEKVGGDWRS